MMIFSKKAYAAYIASIDPTKRYFTQQDINEFSKYGVENRRYG